MPTDWLTDRPVSPFLPLVWELASSRSIHLIDCSAFFLALLLFISALNLCRTKFSDRRSCSSLERMYWELTDWLTKFGRKREARFDKLDLQAIDFSNSEHWPVSSFFSSSSFFCPSSEPSTHLLCSDLWARLVSLKCAHFPLLSLCSLSVNRLKWSEYVCKITVIEVLNVCLSSSSSY